MNLTLEINGVDRTSSIIADSLQKTDVINEKVDTLSFSINRYTGHTFEPVVSDSVECLDGSTTIFKGTVLTVQKVTEGHTVVRFEVNCVDNTHSLSRIHVVESYTNTTINAIIDDLIATYAPTFTTSHVDADVPVESVSFSRISVTDSLQKLAKLSNYSWYVDYDKDVHFFSKNSEPAPFNITDTSENYIYDSLEVSDDISQLRNRVTIQGGEAEGEERSETYDGDGTKKFFKLSNKFAQLPEVTVGGSPVTVGVDFLDDEADFDVLWNYNEQYLKFTVAPASGTNNISVSGVPLFAILVQVEDPASIAEYGLSEYAKVDTSIKSKEEAKAFATAELEAYGEKISEGSLATYTPGLRSGQVIAINSSHRNVNDDFLIQRVTFSIINHNVALYRIQLATLKTVSLIDFLITQLNITGSFLRDSENVLLQKFVPIKEEISITETFTARPLNYAVSFRLAPQAVTGTLRPFIIQGSPLS